MQRAVIISFPGHFFMTGLCIKSLIEFYPDIEHFTIVYDDLGPWSWSGLDQDYRDYANDISQSLAVTLVPFSNWGKQLARISAGWWRQQCVKMSLDQCVEGDSWFVTDGDIVFESRIEIIDIVPVHCLFSAQDPWCKMAENYTDYMLGLEHCRIKDFAGRHCITSSIPFRYVDQELLRSLRQRVEHVHHTDFVTLHADLLDRNEIVAWDASANSMVLHEWDLIEAWRAHHRPDVAKLREIGSGYHVFANVAAGHQTYRHASLRDQQIGRAWFEYRGLSVPDELWIKSQRLPSTI